MKLLEVGHILTPVPRPLCPGAEEAVVGGAIEHLVVPLDRSRPAEQVLGLALGLGEEARLAVHAVVACRDRARLPAVGAYLQGVRRAAQGRLSSASV
ncbi:MAG: hypothetical protein ACRD0J_01915, partial [Acidimicrobiales bacterium]